MQSGNGSRTIRLYVVFKISLSREILQMQGSCYIMESAYGANTIGKELEGLIKYN